MRSFLSNPEPFDICSGKAKVFSKEIHLKYTFRFHYIYFKQNQAKPGFAL